jgi:hypothetical protein
MDGATMNWAAKIEANPALIVTRKARDNGIG